MNLKTLNRFQASGAHLLASGGVALLSAALVFLLWYPGSLAYASGVASIFLMVLGVDVTLGPLITLIIFNPKKKELKFDLLVVALVQLAALFYGLHTVFVARPVYLVFNTDRFDVVYANDLSREDLNKAGADNRNLSWFGPQTVAARLPDDAKARNAILFSAISGGADVQGMPQYYVPYTELQSVAAQRAQPLTALHDLNPDKTLGIDVLIKKYESQKIDAGFVPLKAKVNDLTVVLDKKTGTVLEMVDFRPWK
ncbi:MAG: type IV pilin accessory protein [Burkholderiaceae bacterium]|nr:MAG: type IV pilin accessory protein [Burkholderiaceae bacterium]